MKDFGNQSTRKIKHATKVERLSILDVDIEGAALVRMLNRGPVSEGLRENPTADEPEVTLLGAVGQQTHVIKK